MSGFSFADLQKVADEAGFALVPNGTYQAVVAKGAKVAKSSNDKEMIKVAFDLLPGQPAKGKVFTQFVLSPENPAALGFFFRHMEALGLNREYFSSNPSLEQVAAALEGRSATIEVSTRKWNDQDRNEVKSIKPPKTGSNGVAAAPKPAGVPSIASAPSQPQATQVAEKLQQPAQVPAVAAVPTSDNGAAPPEDVF
jgi:hypothetical protein